MLDWAALAIAGTFASGLVQKGGKYLFETVSGGIVEEQGDKIFCRIVGNIADKFKINTPAENHELVKAFRRACVIGMQHVCTSRKISIGSDNAPSFISKPRNLLLGNAPASLFAEFTGRLHTLNIKKFILIPESQITALLPIVKGALR